MQLHEQRYVRPGARPTVGQPRERRGLPGDEPGQVVDLVHEILQRGVHHPGEPIATLPGVAVHGIDLGTTNSAIARTGPDGRPEVLAGLSGSPTTPSVVLFAGPDEHVVGEGARREARLDPEHVCALVKRRMGEAEWRFLAHGKAWSAPAVSSLILKSLVADAGFATGDTPSAAVITVPAYFGDEERRATVLAGTYAGLDVVDVLSEPIAAALAYGFGRLDGSPDMAKGGPSAGHTRPCLSTTSAAARSTPP